MILPPRPHIPRLVCVIIFLTGCSGEVSPTDGQLNPIANPGAALDAAVASGGSSIVGDVERERPPRERSGRVDAQVGAADTVEPGEPSAEPVEPPVRPRDSSDEAEAQGDVDVGPQPSGDAEVAPEADASKPRLPSEETDATTVNPPSEDADTSELDTLIEDADTSELDTLSEEIDASELDTLSEEIDASGDLDAASGGASDGAPDEQDVGPVALDAPLGGDRPAPVFLPPDYDPATAWPMIMLFHGFAEASEWQSIYYDLEWFAAEKGLIYILPEGKPNLAGLPNWNATFGMCSTQNTDDLGYLVGLIEEAQERFNVNDRQIFLMGHSCGGYMAYRLACERADLIAGFVNHAGGSVAFPSTCTPSEPVTVIHAHGTFDPIVNYYLPVVGQNVAAIGEWWAESNGCDSGPADLSLRDYDKLVWFSETRPVAWDNCDDNAAVRIWRMNGSGHFPALQDSFTTDALDFLLAHPKPGN